MHLAIIVAGVYVALKLFSFKKQPWL